MTYDVSSCCFRRPYRNMMCEPKKPHTNLYALDLLGYFAIHICTTCCKRKFKTTKTTLLRRNSGIHVARQGPNGVYVYFPPPQHIYPELNAEADTFADTCASCLTIADGFSDDLAELRGHRVRICSDGSRGGALVVVSFALHV